jgi:hypothetical protein
MLLKRKKREVQHIGEKIYMEFQAILEGCDTSLDAIQFANNYCEKYPEYKSMIKSMMQSNIYQDNIDIFTKSEIIRNTDNYVRRDDIIDSIEKISGKTNDEVFKRTMYNIANRKNNYFCEKKKIQKSRINKKCPHCNYIMSFPEDTTYVICGHSDDKLGYDWNGCGKDWCFYCGKILCKNWDKHALYLAINRIHTDECCSEHAKETNRKYPDEYCSCRNNWNVRREENDIFKLISKM